MNALASQLALTLSGAFPGVYRAVRGPLLRRRAVGGLPPGLDLEVLEAACAGQTGEHVGELAHSPLMSWNDPGFGAFRVWVRTESDARWSLIYKRMRPRGHDEQGPRSPHLGEVAVYTHAGDELAPFLPDVYWFETSVDEPGSYRFLMEDLWATHRRAHRTSELESIAARLGEIHLVLTRALRSTESPLPKHDPDFLRRTEANAADSIERLAASPPMPIGSSRLLDSWSKTVRVLWLDEFQDPDIVSAIHGDFQGDHALIPVARRGRASSGLRIIDWELAGWGLPEFDLASLLAYADVARTTHVLEAYVTSTERPAAEVHRSYQWCSLLHALFFMRILERRSRLPGGGREPAALLETEHFAGRALAAAQQLDRSGS